MKIFFCTRKNASSEYSKKEYTSKLIFLPRKGEAIIINEDILIVDHVSHDYDRNEIRIFATQE